MAETERDDMQQRLDSLKYGLELDAAYYSRRIKFLETADRAFKVITLLTAGAAGVAFFAIVGQYMAAWFTAWHPLIPGLFGAATGLLVAIVSHIRDSMDIKINILRYQNLMAETSKLTREVMTKANPSENDLITWLLSKRELDQKEQFYYTIVYYQARNDVVMRHAIWSSGRAKIPLLRRAFAHYAFQDNFVPTLDLNIGIKTVGGGVPVLS